MHTVTVGSMDFLAKISYRSCVTFPSQQLGSIGPTTFYEIFKN